MKTPDELPFAHELEPKENYPYVTRSIVRLFNEGALTNVASVDVEPEFGYATRIGYDDGSFRITYGNDLGLNAGASCDLAKDKGHSKFLLKTMRVNVPEGAEFCSLGGRMIFGSHKLNVEIPIFTRLTKWYAMSIRLWGTQPTLSQ